jgi:tetratricopeptide (TPR) repeat protein
MRKSAYFFISVTITILLFIFSLSAPYAAEDFEVFIAQGIQKLNEENYSEALELLNKALELSPDNPEAIYYSAIANARLGNLDQAEKALMKIKKEDEHSENVYFELGRLHYAKENCRSAVRYLKKFKSYSNDSSSKDYADKLIDDCSARTGERPFRLHATLGYQYDSNVVVEANNPSTAVDRAEDGRVLGMITAGARLYEKEAVNVRADYNLYHSVHFDLSDYDVHYHKISPSIELNVMNSVTPSAGYSLEWMIFDNDEYGVIHMYFAKLNIEESDSLSTDGIYEYSDIKYWNTDNFSDNSDRTGRKSSVGVQQNFSQDRLKADIHYFYDDKRATEDWWAYRGYRIGAAVRYDIIDPLRVNVKADYHERDHNDDFPAFGETRLDKMEQYSISFQYAITDKLTATLSGSYTKNDSNIADYEYDRNIVGFMLTYGII